MAAFHFFWINFPGQAASDNLGCNFHVQGGNFQILAENPLIPWDSHIYPADIDKQSADPDRAVWTGRLHRCNVPAHPARTAEAIWPQSESALCHPRGCEYSKSCSAKRIFFRISIVRSLIASLDS